MRGRVARNLAQEGDKQRRDSRRSGFDDVTHSTFLGTISSEHRMKEEPLLEESIYSSFSK